MIATSASWHFQTTSGGFRLLPTHQVRGQRHNRGVLVRRVSGAYETLTLFDPSNEPFN